MIDMENGLILSTEKDTLDKIVTSELIRFIPTFALLMVIFAFGTIGNAMVFYIYKTRHQISNTRMFILFLSALDFFACFIAVPVHAVTIPNQYRLYSPVLCKGSGFLDAVGTLSTSFILISIAVERYRKVCRPFSKQMSLCVVRRLCIASIVVGVLLALPNAFIYGQRIVVLREYPLPLIECSTDDDNTASTLSMVNAFAYGIVFLSAVISIAVMYSFSALAVYKQASKMYQISSRTHERSRSQSDIWGIEQRSTASDFASTLTRKWSLHSVRDKDGPYLFKVKFEKKPNAASKPVEMPKKNDVAINRMNHKGHTGQDCLSAADNYTSRFSITCYNCTDESSLTGSDLNNKPRDCRHLTGAKPCSHQTSPSLTLNETETLHQSSICNCPDKGQSLKVNTTDENAHEDESIQSRSVENAAVENPNSLENSKEIERNKCPQPKRNSLELDNFTEFPKAFADMREMNKSVLQGPIQVSMESVIATRQASPMATGISCTESQCLNLGALNSTGGDVAMRKISPIPGYSRRRVLQTAGRRSVVTMFVVSLTFVVCYIPVLTLLIIRNFDGDFAYNLTNTQYIVYKFFLRSYFLNFAANPIIYGICNVRFRRTCKELFSNCFSKYRGEEMSSM